MSFTLKDLGIGLDTLPNEQWKYVLDTENRYLISNMGRLLTTDWKGSKRPAIMKPALDAHGYLRTMIKTNSRTGTVKVHRVVAQAWIPHYLNKEQVNHINMIKTDNRVENLEWVSAKENSEHAVKNGKGGFRFEKGEQQHPNCCVRGSKVGTAKLTETQVMEIRAKFKPRKYTRQMLADEYGVAPDTIKDVILRSWRHVV
jgi:hypothetical protein